MTTTITAANGIEFEVCNLGVAIVDHEEQWKGWARLSPVQRRALADVLDPGRVPAAAPDDTPHTAGKWTRHDLPSVRLPLGTPREVHLAVDQYREAALGHLNTHHPKPPHPMDPEVATLRRERDAAVARAGQAENARDTAATRAAQLEREVSKVEGRASEWSIKAQQWRERAEAAEARIEGWREAHDALMENPCPVTLDEIEKALRESTNRVFQNEAYPHMAAAVATLVSGDDPAVHVVRESDIAAVEVERDCHDEWFADGEHVYVDDARQADHLANEYMTKGVRRLAVARAIEAEQAVDPVEAKARELYEVGNPGTVGMWESIHEAFKDGYRRMARHVLGQEASR